MSAAAHAPLPSGVRRGGCTGLHLWFWSCYCQGKAAIKFVGIIDGSSGGVGDGHGPFFGPTLYIHHSLSGFGSMLWFQEARKQETAFQQYLSHWGQVSGATGWEQPQLSSSSSYRVQQKKSITSRAHPHRDQGSGWPKSSKEKVDLKTVIRSQKASAKKS